MGSSNGGAPPPGGYGAPPGGYGPPPGGGYGAPPQSTVGQGTPLPPGSYGAPVGGYTPAPPPAEGHRLEFGQPIPYKMAPPSTYAIPARGSFGLGFAIGLFGACIGLGLVFALAKGPDTKKGATVGFGVFLALCVVSQVIGALVR